MKKTILSIVSVALVCVTLLALVSCGSSSGIEGTYTDETGAETLKLKGGKWTAAAAGVTMEGTYVVDEDGFITFKMEANGKDVAIYTGTVDGNKLTVTIVATGQTAVFTK